MRAVRRCVSRTRYADLYAALSVRIARTGRRYAGWRNAMDRRAPRNDPGRGISSYRAHRRFASSSAGANLAPSLVHRRLRDLHAAMRHGRRRTYARLYADLSVTIAQHLKRGAHRNSTSVAARPAKPSPATTTGGGSGQYVFCTATAVQKTVSDTFNILIIADVFRAPDAPSAGPKRQFDRKYRKRYSHKYRNYISSRTSCFYDATLDAAKRHRRNMRKRYMRRGFRIWAVRVYYKVGR